MSPLRALALPLLACGLACETPVPACEEDVRAQVLDEQIEVQFGDQIVLAELADEAVERDRGWRHRRCDREALLLVPDTPASELAIWGCALVEPIDAVFIGEGQVLALERIEPCPEPCSTCVLHGEGLSVDAVLELPLGSADALVPGDPVSF